MINLLEEIDFAEELARRPELRLHIEEAAAEFSSKFDYDKFRKPERVNEVDRYMLVSGFPNLTAEKLQKLRDIAFKNIKDQYRLNLLNERFLESDAKKTLPILLLEYENSQACIRAYRLFDGMVIRIGEKTLNMVSFFLRDTTRIAGLEKFVEVKPLPPSVLQSFKLDKLQREQLTTCAGSELSLNWFDHLTKEVPLAIDSSISVPGMQKLIWSKHGSYAICLLKNEMQLRGGPEFAVLQNFSHEAVKEATFSSDEKYLLSFNGTVKAPNFENYIVWDVVTGTRLRVFRAHQDQGWGAMQFDPSSNFISLLSPSASKALIYELPLMEQSCVIEKQNLKQIAWYCRGRSPYLIAFSFTSDKAKQRCTAISCYKLADRARTEISSYSPTGWDAQALNELVVANDGTYAIAVFTDRKKKLIMQLLLIRKDDNIIYDSVSFDSKFISFSCNLDSNTLALVTINQETKDHKQPKYDVAIFRLRPSDDKKKIQEIGRVDGKATSRVLLASNGTYFALVNTDTGNNNKGAQEFGAIVAKDKGRESKTNLSSGHSMPYMDYAEFDPTGRFLLTVSVNAFNIYTAYGELLAKENVTDSMVLTSWRPRPRLTSQAEKAKVAAEFEKYGPEYRARDKAYVDEYEKKKNAEKYAMRMKFLEYVTAKRKKWQESRAQRKQLYGVDLQDPRNYRTLELQV